MFCIAETVPRSCCTSRTYRYADRGRSIYLYVELAAHVQPLSWKERERERKCEEEGGAMRKEGGRTWRAAACDPFRDSLCIPIMQFHMPLVCSLEHPDQTKDFTQSALGDHIRTFAFKITVTFSADKVRCDCLHALAWWCVDRHVHVAVRRV